MLLCLFRASRLWFHVLRTHAALRPKGLFKKFELNTIKQQAQYAQIFEFYRIDKVVVTFRYKGGNAGIASGSGMWNEVNPLLMFKVDHNDDTADSVATLKDSLKCKTHMFTNNNPEFSIQLKPATQDMIYRSATSTAYSPKWGQWIPTNDITVPHYGLKCYAIGYKSGSLNPGKLSVSYKYYVSFKNNE